MYNDQKLTDISNRLLINTAENADSEELQLDIYCLSYSDNINVVVIDYENGELSKKNQRLSQMRRCVQGYTKCYYCYLYKK